MGKKLIKLTALVLIVVFGMVFAAGCSNKGIEGTWILKEEYDSSGKKISSKELEEIGVSERYDISGTEVVYTCETTLMEKPIVITFELEDLGDNKYNFVIPGGFVFVTAEVKGNTMTYVAGEGKDSSRMVFKRAK